MFAVSRERIVVADTLQTLVEESVIPERQLLLHDCRKATLCPPSLVLGLHARARPHHSRGDGQCAEGSTRVENRECCLVRRSWA
jgi:hypothetical protein